MRSMNKRTCDDSDENTSEDEVTFLLRLRPSPPPRQRRHSLDYKSRATGKQYCASPTGWDITVEHNEQDPGRNKGKPPQSPTLCRRFSVTEGKENPQKNSPKSPLRKFPNFGLRRKKEETRSSPNWEVIIEQKGNERKSSTPPPVPPRIQPSAPPQEFPENWYPLKPPPFYAPHSPQLYQHQQDNCGSLVSPYRHCLTDQNGFENEFLSRNNLTDKSAMRNPLSLSMNNNQVASCLGIGCYNITLTDSPESARSSSSQNFANTTRNSIASVGCSDLISSYTVLPPLPSPGFHVNAVAIVPTLSPQTLPSTSFKTTKPPLPSPRESLKAANLVNTNGGRILSKAKSDLSLNLPVSTKLFLYLTNSLKHLCITD